MFVGSCSRILRQVALLVRKAKQTVTRSTWQSSRTQIVSGQLVVDPMGDQVSTQVNVCEI